jgi:hypothetical protein
MISQAAAALHWMRKRECREQKNQSALARRQQARAEEHRQLTRWAVDCARKLGLPWR